MINTNASLPHWDLSTIYPDMEADEFNAAFEFTSETIEDLVHYFDAEAIGKPGEAPAINEKTIEIFEHALTQFNRASEALHTLYAYVTAFLSTNSRNALAQAWMSKVQQRRATLTKLETRLSAWLGSLDVDVLLTAWRSRANTATLCTEPMFDRSI